MTAPINPFLSVEMDVHSVDAIIQYIVERIGVDTLRAKVAALDKEEPHGGSEPQMPSEPHEK